MNTITTSIINKSKRLLDNKDLLENLFRDDKILENKNIIDLLKKYEKYLEYRISEALLALDLIKETEYLGIENYQGIEDINYILKNKTDTQDQHVQSLLSLLEQDRILHEEMEQNCPITDEDILTIFSNSLEEYNKNHNNKYIEELKANLHEWENSRDMNTIISLQKKVYLSHIINNIKVRAKANKDYEPNILDLGCGKGIFIQEIQQLIPTSHTYGIDKEKVFNTFIIPDNEYSNTTKFIQYDLEQGIPDELKNKKFALIESNNSIQYISNGPDLLKDIYDLLEDKGNGVITLGSIEAIDPERIMELEESNPETLKIDSDEQTGIYVALISKRSNQNMIIPPYSTQKNNHIRDGSAISRLVYCIRKAA